ncbi:NAD(P)/FAD-dependent oxidoreductase [Pleomorphomonas carboxyditropha]|uniref:FAD-dependent oxidoreductase n=1 Tax=Pleomorphomonas carboxyditropha TaxID=2023338 RepID=A0A2G9WRN6_9HYPH|nr:FAD-binding oxidoreductase [Pleomorphomonas carboxyditropha]PIO97371.1 FAD-dependent oxidoreductase [Pleomorphomonas carboxyditropha]
MPDRHAATRTDDLRTGTPLWTRTPHSTVAAERTLPRERFDVIVVGAGISGALVAEALTRAGKSVLIVDRRPPVRGSTPASTAMILHEIDVPLTRLGRQIGEARANAAWRRSARSVGALIDLARRLKIDCDIERKPALYLAGDEMGARALKREAEARTAIGLDADYLAHQALRDRFGLDRPAAILSSTSASANPAQLAAGLLKAALARKARLVSPVEISDMAELPGGVALATRSGAVLAAEHVVFSTGYEHLPQMDTAAHRVVSTWALASRPLKRLPGWLKETIVWEASDPYLYFRTDAAGRVIVGGEDEESSESNSDPDKIARKARAIAGKFAALTGIELGRPAYAWGAPFGVTRDGLPIIDRVPGHERIFAIMGFGGNGITYSMIAAEIVAAAIAGRADPDANLFRYR